MDGRRETIYTNRQIQNHLGFYFDHPGALEFARGLEADYIWLPKALPVVPRLLDAGWQTIYEGEKSIVFADRPHDGLVQPRPPAQGRRSFPGL